MSLSTEYDDEERARLEAPPPLGMPEVPADEPSAPVEAASGDETAQPPGPVAESAPESKPATAVELLAQVKAGQLSRPAIDTAFGPPPTPQDEPGAQTFAPKLGDSAGIDWKGLSDRLSAARDRQASLKTHDNVLNNINSVLNPRFHSDSGDGGVAGVEDELKLGQAKQKMSDEQAAAEGRTAKSQTDAAELARRRDLDSWREMADRMKLTSAAQGASDKNKSEAEKAKTAAEEKAVADQLHEAQLQETTRHNVATEGNSAKAIEARGKKKGGGPAGPMPKEGDIDSVPEDMRETVRAIGEKRAKPPDPGSRFGQKVLGYVLAVYPHLDTTEFGAYRAAKDKLAVNTELQALETARNHLRRARGNIPDNMDSPTANKIRQAILTGVGADTLTPFETDVKVAADELAHAYGNNSETGRATIEHLLAPNQSKPQLEARLNEAEELLTGKMGGLTHSVTRFNVPGGADAFKDAAAQPEAEVTVTNKRTKASRKMSAAAAEKYRDQDAYEVR